MTLRELIDERCHPNSSTTTRIKTMLGHYTPEQIVTFSNKRIRSFRNIGEQCLFILHGYLTYAGYTPLWTWRNSKVTV